VPGLSYPRVPERIMPVACLAVAALVAFAVGWVAKAVSARHVVALVAAAIVVFAADLHVHALKATAADEGNKAYEALEGGKRADRLVELPVFLPDTHYGSVYQYYNTGPQRERPGGYSTTAPVIADVVARQLQPLNCGDWLTRPDRTLRRLGVTEIAFHRGLFVLNPDVPGRAWFAWRGLVEHGYRPWAHDGAVTMLDRQHGGPPPPAPVPEPARNTWHFCQNWYGNDGNGRAMSGDHSALWIYGSGTLRLLARSYARLDARVSVDGATRLSRHFAGGKQPPVVELRVPLGAAGWHLIAFDTPALSEVNGRQEGVRLLSYVDS
jgi:hypothetical protein